MVSDRVPTIKGIRLFQNGTCSKITSICDKTEGKGLSWSGKARTRAEVKVWSRVSKADCWDGPQSKGVSFMVRLNKGRARVE